MAHKIRTFFVCLFFLLFSFLFALALVLGELKFYVLTPAFPEDTLRETNTYEKLVDDPEALAAQAFGADHDKFTSGQPEAAKKLTRALLKSVEPKWLENQAEAVIEAVYDFVRSDQDTINIDVDLREFKIQLRKNLTDWMKEEFASLPEVPLEEFERQIAQDPQNFPKVKPQGFTLEAMITKLGFNPVDQLLARIPDRYDNRYLVQNNPGARDGLAGLKNLGRAFTILDTAFYILVALIVVLLLLAAKLTSKSLREFLLRLGIYLSAAIVPLVIFGILWSFVPGVVLDEAVSRLDMPAVIVSQFLEPILSYALNRVFFHLVVISMIVALTGLMLAIPAKVLFMRASLPASRPS